MANATRVYKFDPRSLPNEGVLVFVGKTGSGKSVLMEDILSYKRQYFKKALIMTGSASASVTYAKHFPSIFIRDGEDAFDEGQLERLVAKQEFLVKKCGCARCKDEPGGKDPYVLRHCLCQPLLLVLDDLGFMAKNIQKCRVVKRIFMNGRHFRILFLFSQQYTRCLEPEMRSQVSHIFLCFEKNPANRARIYDSYNTIFTNVKEFDKVMLSTTQNREVMVLSNSFSQSTAIADNVFWYKAPFPSLVWKMNEGGSAWRFHEERFNPLYYTVGIESKTKKKDDGVLTVTKRNSHRVTR